MTRRGATQLGFTLLEMSIVLVVSGLLLSRLLSSGMGAAEMRRWQQTEWQLQQVLSAVQGFVVLHRRLPCPADAVSLGREVRQCPRVAATGYVPTVTLGVRGPIDQSGRLLDGWNRPIVYAVSASDHPTRGQPGQPDFTTAGELWRVGFDHLEPDLGVCRVAPHNGCPVSGWRANQLPLVLVSAGSDGVFGRLGQPLLEGQRWFEAAPYSQRVDRRFDDVINWWSENELIYHLTRSSLRH